ncbi:putative zinc-binding alcohol dehydrogenase domain-containing protein cipB [Cucurbitaria berberidis CBS 394.84]|uniref:Zinc-binding alcohol dehydrogenase domain-containing protein cipB n=1 Tax=Cucurbitaria berberidis CBS 394.84 TaxID=1168544 RepID=A0A9P4GQS5_9PLEO|nr:putative zinc-binding alcohol dehydrogenase domain-containing protein cipB [Cucurbitaria berberidis CBS 394.84]KAF1850067.1 putative zinc-binding alcohol dehydrogenase domain-containing protein cipB [Cucurbitaria berberidis CBS 394.84]
MAAPKNQAAWLAKADTPLEVSNAPMPTAGPGEIVVKNAAIAINPLDWHMQDYGVFIQQWPAIFGCDVAGEVYKTGPDVQRFKKGDRVIGHTINLISGRAQDGAFALYTTLQADKAAILPHTISFTDGVVVPLALEATICALSLKIPGVAMPGVATPALGLPYPSLEDPVQSVGKTLVVYGGSSSVGSMATQLATAAGIHVIAIAGAHNFDLSKRCGAAQVFDYKDASFVDKVVEAVRKSGHEFVGIFDTISIPDTYSNDLAILAKLGGGHLACSHPPPEDVPANVKAGMAFCVNEIATPVWRDYVTPALQAGKLQCLPPPTVVGNGLEYIQEALKKSKAGVSATKLVVTV